MLGSLGFQEILIILGLALLIFGPRELPKIGRTIGRAMAEFRKASTELKRTLNTEMIQEELRQNDPRKLIRDTAKDLEAAAMADDSEVAKESPRESSTDEQENPSAESDSDDAAEESSATVPRESSSTAAGT